MDRRRREVVHVKAASVRFSPEQYEVLEEIAEEKGIPMAILLRNWALEHMRDLKPERFGRDEEGGR